MIDESLWTSVEIDIFRNFSYKCIACKAEDAVTLHELVPKSLAPKTWDRPENRVPLCHLCHDSAHRIGTSNSKPILEAMVREWKITK